MHGAAPDSGRRVRKTSNERRKRKKMEKQQLLKALDAEAEKIEQRAGPCQSPLSEEKKEEMYQNIMARDPAVWGRRREVPGRRRSGGQQLPAGEERWGNPSGNTPCGWPASCWP